MVYRVPHAAPLSQVPPDRRGRVMGQYCLVCASLYPLHRLTHTGRPVYGRDHIASPCAHEGDAFAPGESWWEPAVEVLPAPAPPGGGAGAAAATSGTPAAAPPAMSPPGTVPPPAGPPPGPPSGPAAAKP